MLFKLCLKLFFSPIVIFSEDKFKLFKLCVLEIENLLILSLILVISESFEKTGKILLLIVLFLLLILIKLEFVGVTWFSIFVSGTLILFSGNLPQRLHFILTKKIYLINKFYL